MLITDKILMLSENDDKISSCDIKMTELPDFMEVHSFLSQVGFTEIETELYIKLLNLGASSISDIHKKTNIPRTTVHENIQKLIQKGIVTQTLQNNKRKVIAESPRQLQTLLMNQKVEAQNKLDKLHKLTDDMGNLINSISALTPQTNHSENFMVKYFQGTEGFLDVHQRTLDNAKKDLLFLSNMDEWKKVFTDDFAYQYYVPERIKKKIFAKTLALDSEIAREIRANDKYYFREMRFLPKTTTFDPTLIISDNEISLMMTTKPYTAIIIYNPAIANMLRSLFNILWEMAE